MSIKKLGELHPGARGIISKTSGPIDILRRLLEMGMLEGSAIEVMHEAPFGKDPIAVRVRGSTIALRRNEANYIEIELESSQGVA